MDLEREHILDKYNNSRTSRFVHYRRSCEAYIRSKDIVKPDSVAFIRNHPDSLIEEKKYVLMKIYLCPYCQMARKNLEKVWKRKHKIKNFINELLWPIAYIPYPLFKVKYNVGGD